MTLSLLENFLMNTVRTATPIMFALVGEMIGHHAGYISISVEGAMLMGCCLGFTTCALTGNLLLAIFVSMLAGVFIGFLQAHFTIHFNANMFSLALAINYLATSLTTYFGSSMITETITGFRRIAIPGLSQLPVIGDAFFNEDILTYISYFLPILCYVFLYKTKLGIAVRSAGEDYQAAAAYGYNVKGLKYGAIMVSAMFAAVGGCQLSCAYTMTWNSEMSGGRGFIASALVILCCWKPLRSYFAAYMFGAAQALQILLQLMSIPIPTNIVAMTPYVITLVSLALVSLNKTPFMPDELKKIGRPLKLSA